MLAGRLGRSLSGDLAPCSTDLGRQMLSEACRTTQGFERDLLLRLAACRISDLCNGGSRRPNPIERFWQVQDFQTAKSLTVCPNRTYRLKVACAGELASRNLET